MVRQAGRGADEALDKYGPVPDGKMRVLWEVLIFRIDKRRGSAHPGAGHGGMLRRMVGSAPMLHGMSSSLDHHQA